MDQGRKNMIALECNNISYRYKQSAKSKDVLREINCQFECGKVYAIVGRSGSGKSTFLSLLAGLDKPDTGQILYQGQDLAQMDSSAYRREKVGVIYQDFALFPLLTVTENIMYPLELMGIRGNEAKETAVTLARRVGLGAQLLNRYPSRISGGEQQRVAIARAMTFDRKVILADEPTGNLDYENCDAIIRLLQRLAHEEECCVVIVTHDSEVIEAADVVMKINHGKLWPVR